MSVEYLNNGEVPLRPRRSVGSAMARGARGLCPKCGEGPLFSGYTSVSPACSACGEELHHQRADDFPPYVVIMVLGHIIVPLLLLVEQAFSPALWIHALLWVPTTIVGALALLPRAKGAIIGWQWAAYMHGFDHHVLEAETVERDLGTPRIAAE